METVHLFLTKDILEVFGDNSLLGMVFYEMSSYGKNGWPKELTLTFPDEKQLLSLRHYVLPALIRDILYLTRMGVEVTVYSRMTR